MKKYEEQYKTCIFFARLNFFVALVADPLIKEEKELEKKLNSIIKKNGFLKTRNIGFLYERRCKKNLQRFTIIASKIGLSKYCPIYNIPGFYAADNANPRKIYQKWCKAFDGQLSDREKQIIIDACSRENNDCDICGELLWKSLNEQANWTWCTEFKHLLNYWYLKLIQKL